MDLLRLWRLAEAWIASTEVRELREILRYRHKPVQLRAGLKAQVHAVMGKHGVMPERTDMFGPSGTAQLDALRLPGAYSCRLKSLRELIGAYDTQYNPDLNPCLGRPHDRRAQSHPPASVSGPQPPRAGVRYVVTLGLGLKRDRTVAMVCHSEPLDDGREGRCVVLDRLQVRQGSPSAPVVLGDIEAWLEQALRRAMKAGRVA